MKFNLKRKIKLFLIVLLVINFLPFFSTGLEAAEFTMTLQVEAEPPIQPEPPSQEGPSQYNPPTIEPEPEQEFPVWLTIDRVNDQYISDLNIPYQFSEQILTFQGQTNIINSIVFLRLSSNPNIIYTTNVYTEDGFWQWTTPYSLDFGDHSLEVVGMSPADPTITVETSLDFQIVKQLFPPEEPDEPEPLVPPVLPEEPGLPLPPTPPLPLEPILPKPEPGEGIFQPDIYSLNIKVLNNNKTIYPKEKLETEVDFRYFGEIEKQLIDLKYIVLNKDQEIIMESPLQVAIEERVIINKNFNTSFTIEPGRYTIIIELEKDGKIFQSSDSFFVKKQPTLQLFPIFFAGALETGINLAFLIIFLGGLFILFFLLLYKEERKSDEDQKKVTVEDLANQHYIDIK